MTQNPNHKQSIEWLKDQLAQQESKLASAETFVVQLKAVVAHLRGVLEVAAFNEAKLTHPEPLPEKEPNVLNGGAVSSTFEEDDLNGQAAKFLLDYNLFEEEDQSNLQPKQPEPLRKKVAEAAESILNKHQSQELKSILDRARRSSSLLSHQ